MLNEGDRVPQIALSIGGGEMLRTHDAHGKLVLYFYPRDDTPGCTQEARDFSALEPAFAAAGTRIVGISKDDAASHARFTAKFGLGFPLASDDGKLCEAFGTWIEKSMYGRKYMGIERATFLIDGTARIARILRKVRVKGHAAEVLKAAQTIA